MFGRFSSGDWYSPKGYGGMIGFFVLVTPVNELFNELVRDDSLFQFFISNASTGSSLTGTDIVDGSFSKSMRF